MVEALRTVIVLPSRLSKPSKKNADRISLFLFVIRFFLRPKDSGKALFLEKNTRKSDEIGKRAKKQLSSFRKPATIGSTAIMEPMMPGTGLIRRFIGQRTAT